MPVSYAVLRDIDVSLRHVDPHRPDAWHVERGEDRRTAAEERVEDEAARRRDHRHEPAHERDRLYGPYVG